MVHAERFIVHAERPVEYNEGFDLLNGTVVVRHEPFSVQNE